MHRSRLNCPRFITLSPACLLILVLLQVGCFASPKRVLPTLVPTIKFEEPAILATTARATRKPPPATYTPAPTQGHLITWLPTGTLAIPSSTPTAIQAARPKPLSISGDFPHQIQVLTIDAPPQFVECGVRGLVYKSQFPSTIGGPWRSYHAYLPPCYGYDGQVYPVLYLFHGSIQNDSHWLELGLAEYMDAEIASGSLPPFVVIMPNNGQLGNYTSGGSRSIEGVTVNNLMPFIEANYCTWQSRAGRAIGGSSRGGYWALEIGFMHPELFGAVAGHSSHLRLETDPEKYNPLTTYLTSDLSRMRIWLDWGEEDFLRSGQSQLHKLLEAAGISHDYVINPGGHSDAYWAEHLAEYIDWHGALWPKDRQLYDLCN